MLNNLFSISKCWDLGLFEHIYTYAYYSAPEVILNVDTVNSVKYWAKSGAHTYLSSEKCEAVEMCLFMM